MAILGLTPGQLVLRPRITVDVERLMNSALAYPGLRTLPRVDVDSFDHLPLLEFTCGNGHMIRNGYPGAGWEWTLFLTLWAEDLGQGGDLADTVYQNVHRMENVVVADVGCVTSVEDVAMFDRIGGATVADRNVVQYNATFNLVVVPV